MSNSVEINIPDHRRGIILILTAMICFASMDAITKYLVRDISVVQILWIRYLGFTAVISYFVLKKKSPRKMFRSKYPKFQILRSILIVTEAAGFATAIIYLPLADTHAIMATFPLIITAMAAIFLREHVGFRRWCAVLIGFIGVLMIIKPGFIEIQIGTIIAIATAVMFATYNIMTRWISQHDDSETSLMYMSVIGLLCLSLLVAFFWQPFDSFQGLLLAIVIVLATSGHAFLVMALRAAPATVLQPYNYTLLVFATLLGWLVYDNIPDNWTIAGAMLVVLSGLFVWMRENRKLHR